MKNIINPTPEEIEEYELSQLDEAKKAMEANDQSGKIINKFKSFLSFSGEKKSKTTGELFREHIPASVFGIASDEVASDLGISENELMARLTQNFYTFSADRKTSLIKVKPTKKQQPGFDFLITNQYSGFSFTIRAISLISFSDDIALLYRQYFNGKLKSRIYGLILTGEELLRFIADANQLGVSQIL